jgi:YebC/PmpR family DNA-binding regulatory protein
MTDNRNRTAADVRHIFTKYGGNLGSSGAVAWMFDRKGVITIPKSHPIDEDTLFTIAIEAGAEDMSGDEDQWEITTDPTELHHVKSAVEQQGVAIDRSEISLIPKNIVELNKEDAGKVLRFIDVLEDNDDVQDVYANFDIPAEIMDELA